jgi:outer membrane protein assembly factor BamB
MVARVGRFVAAAGVAAFGLSLVPGAVDAATPSTDWTGYEHGPAHSSTAFNDTAITAANASSLRALWTFHPAGASAPGQPGSKIDASPIVAGGRVYVAVRTGVLYALSAATGAIVWQRQLDYGSAALCSAKGIVGTPTVATDPVSGVLTVYAAGAHYLYALNAATGALFWKTSIGPDTADGNARYFNWASPTVSGGQIFMGLGANCEADLVRGGLVSLDQHTGSLLHTYYAVPAGDVGASVWSSAATSGSSVWITTGNPDPTDTQVYDSYSVVRLASATLAKQEKYTVALSPSADLDFGSSPTLFNATVSGTVTPLVAACNKNGVLYAWPQTGLAGGPLWSRQIGSGATYGSGLCITSPAYDSSSKRLIVAANAASVAGVTGRGVVMSLAPATGKVQWQKGLPCAPVGTPTVNGTTKVVAVPLFSCPAGTAPGVRLYDESTGAVLATLPASGPVFAQPVFAEGKLFVAAESGGLTAYGP